MPWQLIHLCPSLLRNWCTVLVVFVVALDAESTNDFKRGRGSGMFDDMIKSKMGALGSEDLKPVYLTRDALRGGWFTLDNIVIARKSVVMTL